MNQSQAILQHLLSGETLTPISALERFKCFRLGARCYDLRKAGYNVKSEMIETPSGKWVSQYWIDRDQPTIPVNGHKKEKKGSTLDYIKSRRDYFAARNPHNGWSGNESGPCCGACAMRGEHYTGRADALKALAGRRNPFQLPEVCQCHIATRQAVTNGIVEVHDQLIRYFEKNL